MADLTLAEFYAKALAEAGGGGGTVLPDGDNYHVRLDAIKRDQSKSGKFQVSLKWTVLDGPYGNQSCWTKQTLTLTTADGSPNFQAVGIYLSQLAQLGVDEAFIRSGQVGPEALWDYVVKGLTGHAKFGHHDYNGKTFQDLKNFRLETAPQVSVTPTGTPNVPSVPTSVPAASAAPVPVVVVPSLPNQGVPVTAPVVVQAPFVPPTSVPAEAPTGTAVRF